MSGRLYPHLLTPLSLRGVLFENRVLAAPMGAARAMDGGRLSPEGVDSYESRARGGFAQVTVDEPGLELTGADPRLEVLVEALRGRDVVAALRLSRPADAAQTALAARAAGFQALWLREEPGTDAAALCAEIRASTSGRVLLQLEVQVGEDDLLTEARINGLRELEPQLDLLVVKPVVRPCPGLDEVEQGLALVGAVKEQLRLPVAALVELSDPGQGERAIAAGRCDFIALGHQQLADPDFVRKAALGRGGEIIPSLHALCPAPTGYSAANPWTGRELRWRQAPRPGGKRRVMVVGGGPAGLSAAVTAAGRGHDVILVERCANVGGLLWQGEADPNTAPLVRLREALKEQCRRLGVKFQLSTDATREYVARMAPDAIVCATGSASTPLRLEGGETHHVLYAYDNPHHIGHRVVIVGGGPAGCQGAMYLADRGHPVTLLEREGELLPRARAELRERLLARLTPYTEGWNGQGGRERITVRLGAIPTALAGDSLVWQSEDGESHTLMADTVLYAVGRQREDSVAVQLRDLAPFFRCVGDCRGPGDVAKALFEGAQAALDIL